MDNKRKISILTTFCVLMANVLVFAEDASSTKTSDDSNWQSTITGMLGGIPISSDVTYSYASSGSLSADVYCMPSKAHPQVGESVTVTCVATPRDGAIATPPVQTKQIVTESGGKTSVAMDFTLFKHIGGKDPYDLYGKTKATVNANVYEGTTGLGDNSTTNLDKLDPVIDDNSNSDSGGTTSDPTYNNGTDTDLGNIDWGNLAENSNGNGNNPQDNLDSYFNDGAGSPNIEGSDLLGTDGYVEENSVNNTTEENSNINYEAEGIAPNGNGAGAYDKNGNYVGEGYGLYDAFGNYVGYKANVSNDNSTGGLAQAYNEALGSFGSGNNKNNSLLDKIINNTSDLAKKTSSLFTDENSTSDLSSNQDLYDIAKKMLLSSGLSMDDIKKGKNYDKGSAYSEPTDAWDLNRITTLMSSKKIKIDNTNKGTTTTTTAKTTQSPKNNKLI